MIALSSFLKIFFFILSFFLFLYFYIETELVYCGLIDRLTQLYLYALKENI